MELLLTYTTTYWYVVLCAIVFFYLLIDDLFFQRQHAIRTTFPALGRMRYFLEMIGPELRQYWVSNDKEEAPFNRDERRWILCFGKRGKQKFWIWNYRTTIQYRISPNQTCCFSHFRVRRPSIQKEIQHIFPVSKLWEKVMVDEDFFDQNQLSTFLR